MRRPASNTLAVAFGLQACAGHALGIGLGSDTPPGFCGVSTVEYALLQQCPRIGWSSEDPNERIPNTEPTQLGIRDGTGEEDPEELATSSFMSFEEWKVMMLQKRGQDPADLKERKRREGHDRSDLGPNDVLDSWGDDGEIALNFDGIPGKITDVTANANARSGRASGEVHSAKEKETPAQVDGMATYQRPKDAGKTCKERFSYASFDGGATVLKTSPGVQNSKAILVENKDAYMLFQCSQKNKFVIVELSEDILVDTVVLANFEFFSSTFRNFRVSVSDKYPVMMDKWQEIGTFEASNSRAIQSFLVQNPKIYAKYIRFEFLSHYGKEYYCPVSLLRVHGTRMLDSWKDVENAVSDNDEPADVVYSLDEEPEPKLSQETAAVEPEATGPSVQRTSQADHSITGFNVSPWYPPLHNDPRLETCAISTPTTTGTAKMDARAHVANGNSSSGHAIPSNERHEAVMTTGEATVSSTAAVAPLTGTSSSFAYTSTRVKTSETTIESAPSSNPSVNKTEAVEQPAEPSVTPAKSPPGTKIDGSSSKPTQKQPPTTAANKDATGSSSSAAASPTIQESFFKSMTKRITYLEGNVTLSMQYIEEQSKFLQDALQKMERRQIKRVDDFLHHLNQTVLRDIVVTLESHRKLFDRHGKILDRHDRQILALSVQVGRMAGDISLLQVLACINLVLVFCCLVLLLLPRLVHSGTPAEQWANAGHFFNYLGSPRLPPSTPPSARGSSNGHTTPTQQHRPLRWQSASTGIRQGFATLHPGDHHQQQRSVSGPAALMDKVLPLTPSSDVFDRSDDNETGGSPTPPRQATRSPPLIRVEDAEDFLVKRDAGEIKGLWKKDRPLIEEIPTPLEEAPTFVDDREGEQSDVDEEGHQGESDTSKPPLTRSPLSKLGGSSRKPLPALPEDPV